MFKRGLNKIVEVISSRALIGTVVFIALMCVLVYRLFDLQIINGESYLNDFTMQIKKERTLTSTRGNIYDKKGYPLAYNETAYNVTIEDSGSYSGTMEKNLTLNSVAYKLIQMIEENGDNIIQDFGILIDENNNYIFADEGTSLYRFKADIYGYATIDKMSSIEKNATAQEMMDLLMTSKRYGLEDSLYTKEELAEYDLPEQFTQEEILKIVTIRSAIAANSYQKYVASTVATGVSEETVAVIYENMDELIGVDVVVDTTRVYNDSVYFAPILGYTGKASQAELEELENERDDYVSNDVIGKAGIEKKMELELQGQKGYEEVYVDSLGKELEVSSTKDPQAGNDVYLTIDRDLQIVTYKVIEENLAGILSSKLINQKTFDFDAIENESQILLPVYDVYFALIDNNVVDITRLNEDDATDTEKSIYSAFTSRQEAVLQSLRDELTSDSPTIYKDATEEMQVYFSYIVSTILMSKTNLLPAENIDTSDEIYLAWTDVEQETVSLREYLEHAISLNWIDVSSLDTDSRYLDSSEIYEVVVDYILEYAKTDTGFSKKIYKYMLLNGHLMPSQVCLLLFDQGVLEEDENSYNSLMSGDDPYYFIKDKIDNIDITPAQLALDPCSASAVVTDPNTGDILACVTYPGYDNNRLANTMDAEYYNELLNDLSTPLYNKATQQLTAPGSTFKPVSGIAAIMATDLNLGSGIVCNGKFDRIEPHLHCWDKTGSHGSLTLTSAIGQSCNVYFAEAAWKMGRSSGQYNVQDGLDTLETYAAMFGLTESSGIEITESEPMFSTEDPLRSAIGQGTHNYTTTQLARYATALANQGTVYNISLLDKLTDYDNNVLEEYESEVSHVIEDIPDELWSAIKTGMGYVTQNNEATQELYNKMTFAGKTGTAQESEVRPNHALFVGYAPYDNPEIAISVRIANGYTSKNAAALASEILSYQFEMAEEEDLVTGVARENTFTATQTD